MEKEIAKYYYDPSVGFVSAQKLYQKLKSLDSQITLKDIKDFIKRQYTAQVNRPIPKPKNFSSIVSPSVGHNFQMDIMVYDRYEYHHYKYILVVVDVYSRFAMARAMTNRTMPTIMKNITEIFSVMGIPKNINTDNEFNKKSFNSYAKEHGITTWFSLPNEVNKNAICERLNRTIAELLQKWRTATGRYDWYNILPQIMDNYNNTRHNTIKATPQNVFDHLDINHQILKKVEIKLKVGDQVRIRTEKKVFDKGDLVKFSKKVYTIIKIVKEQIYLEGMPDVYFKAYQLQPVREVENYEAEASEQEPIHQAVQKQKKIKRKLNKEGIEGNEVALRRSARERKPDGQLEDVRYGRVRYS